MKLIYDGQELEAGGLSQEAADGRYMGRLGGSIQSTPSTGQRLSAGIALESTEEIPSLKLSAESSNADPQVSQEAVLQISDEELKLFFEQIMGGETFASSEFKISSAGLSFYDMGEEIMSASSGGAHIICALPTKDRMPATKGYVDEALAGKLDKTATAAAATKLAAARTIQTNLASSSAASFNGTANVTPGVTGVLRTSNGGTGNTSGYVQVGKKVGTTIGEGSTAEGGDTTASGLYSHAEGYKTTVSGGRAHAEGYNTIAEGDYSHAEGSATHASGAWSHAEGSATTASWANAHAEGWHTIASANCSHAEGQDTTASGAYSHAQNLATFAEYYASTAMGRYNVKYSPEVTNRIGYYLVIGKGASEDSRANCFRVQTDGVFATGSYNSTGADYAELFEWLDGNPEAEDRAGLFVTLEGENIRIAGPQDDFILGVLSGNPSVVGDVHDDQWAGMYLYDIYGRPLWEDVEVPAETVEEPDPENPERTITRELLPAHTERRQKLNPDYDSTQKYIPRTERPEWGCVGLLGKLVVRDDGNCVPNGWCAVGEGGIAVASVERTRFRCLSRLDGQHVRILIL